MSASGSAGALVIIGAAWLGLGAPAQAQAEIPVTWYFAGHCEECAALAGTTGFLVTGELTLQGCAQGQALTDEDFVSLTGSGSNLLDPYRVDVFAASAPAAAGASVVQHFFTRIEGSLVLDGPQAVRIDFGDGLGFVLEADRSFFTCGVKGSDHDAVDCSPLYHNDFGTGLFLGAPVPEPGSYALMCLGLAALGWRLRGRRTTGR